MGAQPYGCRRKCVSHRWTENSSPSPLRHTQVQEQIIYFPHVSVSDSNRDLSRLITQGTSRPIPIIFPISLGIHSAEGTTAPMHCAPTVFTSQVCTASSTNLVHIQADRMRHRITSQVCVPCDGTSFNCLSVNRPLVEGISNLRDTFEKRKPIQFNRIQSSKMSAYKSLAQLPRMTVSKALGRSLKPDFLSLSIRGFATVQANTPRQAPPPPRKRSPVSRENANLTIRVCPQ